MRTNGEEISIVKNRSSQMMAVAVFPKKKTIELVTMKTPKITRSDHVKLKILDVGICGTDREICSFEYGSPPEGSDFLVIGHESLGRVVEVGHAVSKFRVGDLAVVTVRRPCPHRSCRPCRAGYPDFCSTGDYIERGIKEAHGFMAEYVIDRERYVHKVPQKLREVAVLAEPLTIAEKAIDQSADIVHRLPWISINGSRKKYGRLKITALVLGAGPVGLLGAMALVSAGSNVYVYALAPAPNPNSRFLESIGARYYSEGKVPPETRDSLMGRVHLIYEATGVSRLAFNMLRLLGHNSEIALTGVPSLKQSYEIDGDLLMKNIVLKNQVLFGTVNASSENFDEAIKDIGIFKKKWPKSLESLITDRVPVEKAPEALLRRGQGIKTIVTFD